MKLTHLRTNHFTEPLGMTLLQPIFSWVTEETASRKQAAAQIKVAAGGREVYDSGRREDISSLGFEAPIELLPRTRYTWTVTVWGNGGDSASASSWFETAKENEPWQAKWIAADFEDKELQPLFAKDFLLDGDVEAARVYACGLGIYELEINGQKAGDEYLLPGYHTYDFNVEYQTFDVTGLLQPGANTVGFSVGPGWYKGDIVFDRYHDLYGDTMQIICELHILKKDGTEQVVVSDDSWSCYHSPVTFSNIYDGEHFDAERAIPGWSKPGCTAEKSKAVLCGVDVPLEARKGPKILKKQEFSPVEILHTKAGETVLDFGQNMTGWVEFICREPAGTQVRLSYGEVLQNGCFYRDNLRSAKAEYLYISDGTEAHVRPHFTFYGFRYVKVEGVSEVRREDFTACHIRSDIDPIGQIETSDSRVNQLFHNAMWGQFDNFLDLPTDCPQRDERLGWTGDAAVISGTACKNIYMPAFFHHFIENVRLEQNHFGGAVPFYVPAPKKARPGSTGIDVDPADFVNLKPEDTEAIAAAIAKYPKLQAALADKPESERLAFIEKVIGENYSFEKGNYNGCAIWSDVATMMPWAVYENFGDLSLLRREYPVMKDWVERIRRDDRLDGDRGLWLRGHQLGDWLALDREDGDTQNPFGATNLAYTASAFYYYSASLTAKAAKALGLSEDQAEYEGLCRKIKNTFVQEYFSADGGLKIHETQTACVLSLFFGLYPEGCRDKVRDTLKKLLEKNDLHLNTGFCGTPFLCRALSDSGDNEYAYTLLLNEDYPSWLYEVKLGATTVWERWNSLLPDGSISGTNMNSLNHYAYGSIVDWMYRNLCGLNPCEEAPGYKKALIRPMPDPRLQFAKMRMDSASGLYEVEWRYEGDALRYAVTVPFDCEAELVLPDGTVHTLTAGSYTF